MAFPKYVLFNAASSVLRKSSSCNVLYEAGVLSYVEQVCFKLDIKKYLYVNNYFLLATILNYFLICGTSSKQFQFFPKDNRQYLDVQFHLVNNQTDLVTTHI